jgi:phosphoribosylglycinamide formyltransferase 2
MSSSGKGQSVVQSPEGIAAAWESAMAGARGSSARVIVEELFGALEVLELLEGTVHLDEGPRHQGRAEVVRALLRKPA